MLKAYNISGSNEGRGVTCAVCGNSKQYGVLEYSLYKLIGAHPRKHTYVHGRCIHPDSLAVYLRNFQQAEAEYYARRDKDEDRRQGLIK